MANYIVLQTLWHSKEQKEYAPGESVNLDHLEQGVIDQLVEQGAVASDAPTVSFDSGRDEPRGKKGKSKNESGASTPSDSPEGGMNA